MIKKERVAEDEIYAIVREMGLGSIEEADAIVLGNGWKFNGYKASAIFKK